jgi:hypothetical protein
VFNLADGLAHGFGSQDVVGTVPLGVAPVGLGQVEAIDTRTLP